MALLMKFSLSLFIYTVFSLSCLINGEIILTEDKEYEVINFSIPKSVIQNAINPTPMVKSAVTMTVPVILNEEEEENDVEDEDVEVPEVIEASAPSPVEANVPDVPIVQNQNVTQVQADVTEAPVVDEELGSTTAPQQIFGQVIRFPCSCVEGQCGCCTGTILQRVNMKACGNITFVPEDFVFDVRMTVNNKTVVRQRVSASDPPPICFNPRRFPILRICAEITNIRIRNRNAFACLDINADIADFPVYSASFRCFGLGTSGVQTGLKPKPQTSTGPKPINLFGSGSSDSGGILENAAETILGDGGAEGGGPGLFGQGGGGILGGAGGLLGGGGGSGPLGAIGNAVGGILGGRKN